MTRLAIAAAFLLVGACSALAQSTTKTYDGELAVGGSTTCGTACSFTVNVGTSCPTPYIVVGLYALNTSTAAQSPAGTTIGGVAATILKDNNNNNGSNNGYAALLGAQLAGNGSQSISVHFSQSALRMDGFVYSMCGLPSTTPAQTSAAGGTATLSLGLNTNIGDIGLFVSGSNSGNTSSWSGATLDHDANIGGAGTHAAAASFVETTAQSPRAISVGWGSPSTASNSGVGITFAAGASPPPPPPTAPPGTVPAFVAVPLPRPATITGSGWASPGTLPTNDAITCAGGYWACKVADQGEAQSAFAAGGSYDLLIGDSIIALCDASQFTPFPVANFGIAGNTVGGLINQIDQIVHNQVSPQVNTLGNLHTLIVQIGVNNIGTLGQTAAQIEPQLQSFFNAYSGPLIWSGILPAPTSSGWNTEIQAINSWASGALASRPHTHDISAAVAAALSSSGAMNPSYQLVVGGVAGIHYNGAGCAAWGSLVFQSTLLPF